MADKNIEIRKSSTPMSSFDLMPEFENMMERFFGSRFDTMLGDWPTLPSRGTQANIQETDQWYILYADMPGIQNSEIEIDVRGNLLTIHAEHKEESGEATSQQGYRRQYRRYHQSFALPTTVDPDKIEAHCENGVLEVLLPKVEQAKPKRVEVKSGQGGLFNRLMNKVVNNTSSGDQAEDDVKH